MELHEASEAISRYLWECNKIIHKKGHSMAKEYGLTYDQFHTLLYLKHSDKPPTINDISNKLKRAQNTISEMVTRLEEKGLVKRVGDENDRRITRVLVTEEGIDLVRTIKKERSNRTTYIALSKMEDGEIRNLLFTLEKLYNNLKEEGEDA